MSAFNFRNPGFTSLLTPSIKYIEATGGTTIDYDQSGKR
jgi:hypothetical protein